MVRRRHSRGTATLIVLGLAIALGSAACTAPGDDGRAGGRDAGPLRPATEPVDEQQAAADSLAVIDELKTATVEIFTSGGSWGTPRTLTTTNIDSLCVVQTSVRAPVSLGGGQLEEIRPKVNEVLAAHGIPAAEQVSYINGSAALDAGSESIWVLWRGAELIVEISLHPDQCG